MDDYCLLSDYEAFARKVAELQKNDGNVFHITVPGILI